MTKIEYMEKIQQVMFALQETALYLDSHPNDLRVLERHNHYSKMLETLTHDYLEEFNMPFSNLQVSENCWNYINDPWPWAMTSCCKEERN